MHDWGILVINGKEYFVTELWNGMEIKTSVEEARGRPLTFRHEHDDKEMKRVGIYEEFMERYTAWKEYDAQRKIRSMTQVDKLYEAYSDSLNHEDRQRLDQFYFSLIAMDSKDIAKILTCYVVGVSGIEEIGDALWG